ncbi:alpha/beta hydrolase [Streptomyces bauhiniae]|uniref:alpha/beta hydrolase n=1 Tax=Streptomyces bauhiniae TaxID=2340725 RepID=UPI0033229698
MTSFGISPQLSVWRTLLALSVVFVMLATTGWTAQHTHRESTALRSSLAAWVRDSVHGKPLPDPAKTAPARLARFFGSLTPYDRHDLATRYPLAVGNMNGAPVGLRYEANRVALERERDVESRRVHDNRLSTAGQQDAARRMHRYEALMRPERHILAFDPEGSGRIAEVFGDLRRAQRISVVVPGVDTDLLTFEKSYRPYSAPVGMAKSLYSAERQAAPATRTAVIAWADYTAPAGLGVDAATAMRATEGAVRLNALLRGLPGRAEVSMFCHSYGSVVCGVAAPGMPRRVSDIAVAASPGMRAASAAHLNRTARVWAMRDATDWVQDVPYLEVGGLGHGADPVSRAFGARVLSSHDAQGHAGYFQPGTDSLRNLAHVGVGAYGSVTCARADEACRADVPDAPAAGRA